MITENRIKNYRPSRVEYSSTIKSENEVWISLPYAQPLTSEKSIDGTGGSASIKYDFGKRIGDMFNDRNVLRTLETKLELTGKYVRILLENSQGYYTPHWYGKIDSISDELSNDGDSGSSILNCSEISNVLKNSMILHSFQKQGTEVLKCYGSPKINEYNNRSIQKESIPGTGDPNSKKPEEKPKKCFIFDLSNPTNDNLIEQNYEWKLGDLIEYLIITQINFNTSEDSPWDIALEGDLNMSNWPIKDLDLYGRSVHDVLCSFINPNSGLMWEVRVDDKGPTILIRSITSEIVGESPVIIPKSIYETSIKTQNKVYQGNLSVSRDDWQYDEINVTGDAQTFVCSLSFKKDAPAGKNSLAPDGWYQDLEPEDDTGIPTDKKVWKSWKLDPTWDGYTFINSGTGKPDNYIEDASPVSLSQLWLPQVFTPPSKKEDPQYAQNSKKFHGIKFLRDCLFGQDWDLTNQATVKEKHKVFLMNKDGVIENVTEKVQVTVDQFSISLGRAEDGSESEDYTYADMRSEIYVSEKTLIITIGLELPFREIYSWKRDKTEWPRANPRVLLQRLSDTPHIGMLHGTIQTLDESRKPIRYKPTINYELDDSRDNITPIKSSDKLQRLTTALKARYGTGPLCECSWEDKGTIDDTKLGTIVTKISSTDHDTDVLAPIVSISYTYTLEDFGTKYRCNRTLGTIE